MSNGSSDTHVRIEAKAGRITLDRPRALNALTYPQIGVIAAALDAWEHDPAVAVVIIDATGGKAFCAGGDVRTLYDAAIDGPAFARRFWLDEYRLNARISRYGKPYVAIMDGIVMGGGVGLSAHGRHRVVTERTSIAMPETTIGLIPDVGGTWLLSRPPRSADFAAETGTYLALTGERITATDAIGCGLADVAVASAHVPRLIEAIARSPESLPDVLAAVRAHPDEMPPPRLPDLRAAIDATFQHDRIAAILTALDAHGDARAREIAAALGSKSPLSLTLTLEALRRARNLPSLEAALAIEFKLVTRLYDCGEFIEGIRALLVDKDRMPKWRPATVGEVTPELAASFFAALPEAMDRPFD